MAAPSGLSRVRSRSAKPAVSVSERRRITLPSERTAPEDVEADMRYEYRLERVPIPERGMLVSRLLDRLNEQSRNGWRVAGLDLGVRHAQPWSQITLLLVRERRAEP